MGYNKIVVTGDILELYQYEKDRPIFKSRSEPREDDVPDEVVGASGEGSLPKGQLGRRPDHARRASASFRRLVRANLGGGQRPILLTLTYADNFEDLGGAYRHLTAFFKAFRSKDLGGTEFRYVCVPEFQRRGAVHFHALVWGLSPELCVSERRTRRIARLWGKGFVYLKETDGDSRLSSYLAKYMSKAFMEPRLAGKKAYVSSRNINRPVFILGVSPVWPVLEDYSVDNYPCEQREYLTQWLGRCRYRTYTLKSNLNGIQSNSTPPHGRV